MAIFELLDFEIACEKIQISRSLTAGLSSARRVNHSA
jgi:hypothetical protein